MKVVLDTNILISATIWDNSEAQKLLLKLIEKNIAIYSSKEILEEYQKVLARDFDYTEAEILSLTNLLLNFLIILEPIEKLNVIKDDPEDNKIIECALSAEAEYVVTYDKHLLDVKSYKNVQMRKPEEIIF
ncbi:MAG TPA: putative toxin-antitoxin system toxin component, PIN family [Candidatus Nanoarchaeia archaeon]|nr:putative toxin-antitoxin system toxin component, PIN family [Candidatus Nanoarchaeia archaeon]